MFENILIKAYVEVKPYVELTTSLTPKSLIFLSAYVYHFWDLSRQQNSTHFNIPQLTLPFYPPHVTYKFSPFSNHITLQK